MSSSASSASGDSSQGGNTPANHGGTDASADAPSDAATAWTASNTDAGQAGINPDGTGQGSTAGSASGERTGASEDFVEALAGEIAEMLENGELDEQFFKDAGMTEEELIAFTKKYEGLKRPERDQSEDADTEKETSPDGEITPIDANRGLVLGGGVDEDASSMGIAASEDPHSERFEDLFDEYEGNVSDEYRDLIEAYYKKLARQRR